nr:hypothetical protein GCM10020093_063870 [Planobispora longispora]
MSAPWSLARTSESSAAQVSTPCSTTPRRSSSPRRTARPATSSPSDASGRVRWPSSPPRARPPLPPHRIPYRANLWALRSLGVRQVLAPSAVGSLRPELGPGTLVVPDQLVDRTSGRVQTYYDAGGVVHVSFSDPYCPAGRAAAVSAAGSADWEVADGGTLVVIEGPRFSTRAESRWFTANGWSIVGMTGFPESVLARELAMCYTSLSLVTDHDAGVEAGEGSPTRRSWPSSPPTSPGCAHWSPTSSAASRRIARAPAPRPSTA